MLYVPDLYNVPTCQTDSRRVDGIHECNSSSLARYVYLNLCAHGNGMIKYLCSHGVDSD